MMLDELIAKLEDASEGNWELDESIALAIGWTKRQLKQVTAYYAPGSNHMEAGPPRFTRSLDAALTLVNPPGHVMFTWTIKAKIDSQHDYYWAEITVPSSEYCGAARTPALALCIAALRARRGEG